LVQVSSDSDPSTSTNQKHQSIETVNEPRRSQRVRKEKSFGSDFVSPDDILFSVEGSRGEVLNKIPIVLNIENEPKIFKEAMASRDSSFWKEAINDEIDSLLSNNTWFLIDLPPRLKSIGCKWEFRIKYNTHNYIQCFKARLVAQGFTQEEGIDYCDTYAPMARISFIRTLLALASIYKLEVHQMHVKTTFLNGDLDEEVHMKRPEGFIMPEN